MLRSHYSFGEVGEAATACRRATWVLGETSVAAVYSALSMLSRGHGKEVAAELLLDASGQSQQARPLPGSGGVIGLVTLSLSSSWSSV